VKYLSQSKAAKLVGVSRGTIANRVAVGLLSKSSDGIDLEELVAAFPDTPKKRVKRFLCSGELPEDLVNHSSAAECRNTADQSRASVLRELSAQEQVLVKRLEAAERNAEWLRKWVDQSAAVISEARLQINELQEKLDRREEFWIDQVRQARACCSQ